LTNLLILGGVGVGSIITGVYVFLNRRQYQSQVTDKKFDTIQKKITQRDRDQLEAIKKEITRIEGGTQPDKTNSEKKDSKFRRRR
jgi:hypothetical protein